MQGGKGQKQGIKKTSGRKGESKKTSGATKDIQRSVASPEKGDGEEEQWVHSDIEGGPSRGWEGESVNGICRNATDTDI